MRQDAKKVLDGSFREWLTELETHMEAAINKGESPQLTFEVCGIIYQIRVMNWPGLYTDEDYSPPYSLDDFLKDELGDDAKHFTSDGKTKPHA